MNSSHVRLEHPGQGKVDMHASSVHKNSTWKVCNNENKAGENPYAMSYPETSHNLFERKRNTFKETTDTIFQATSRTTSVLDDRTKS